MLVEHLAALGFVHHCGVQMFEKASVTATHVANTPGLQIHGPVEYLDDDLIHLLEICAVRAAAAPHVHAAVDQQFHSTLVHSRDAGITEQKRTHIVEEREIGDGDSVGSGNLGRVTATRGQAHGIFVARDPVLRCLLYTSRCV